MTAAEVSDETPGRILIAEDDAPLLRVFEEALGESEYTVFGALSFADAKSVAEHQQIDLAILDVKLQDGSGVELGRILTRDHGIPFLQITGDTEQSTIDSSIEAGAVSYLVKPVEIQQLLPAVSAALSRSREVGKLIESVNRMATDNERRRTISIAVGVILERFRVSEREAFEILRYTARSRQEQIANTAREIIEGNLGFDLIVKLNRYLDRQ